MLCTFLVLSICLSLKVISVFNGFQIETVREGDVTFNNTLFLVTWIGRAGIWENSCEFLTLKQQGSLAHSLLIADVSSILLIILIYSLYIE